MTRHSLSGSLSCAVSLVTGSCSEGQISVVVCSPHVFTLDFCSADDTASSTEPTFLIHLCHCCLLFWLVLLTSLYLERPDSTFSFNFTSSRKTYVEGLSF